MLLRFSVLIIIKRYDQSKDSLLIDDTKRARCKRTRKIGNAHKIREKKTSGYIQWVGISFSGLANALGYHSCRIGDASKVLARATMHTMTPPQYTGNAVVLANNPELFSITPIEK